MRIAYVISSVEGGGAAMPVPAIAAVLRDLGAEVFVLALTGRDRRALAAILRAGFNVEVRPNGERDHLRAFRWLDRAIATIEPDIIWTSLTRATLLGQLVGARRRIPVVSWQHAAFLRPANRRMLRFMRNRTALWIADSQAVNAFAQSELRVSELNLMTWPLFAADPDAIQAPPWQPGQLIRIGSLGRLHPVKGYDILIEALALVRELNPDAFHSIHVSIAGEGGDRRRLVALARQAEVENLTFMGFCAEPSHFLAGLDLYVQPSRSEGFCVAAHEAMQAGIPVIASAVGEIANSLVSGETGISVPPGDSRALALAILRCVSAPEDLKAMGEAGRRRLLSRFNEAEFRAGAERIVRRLERLSLATRPISP
jgi:glycosyltransferase involved in cell wall biosynthesis